MIIRPRRATDVSQCIEIARRVHDTDGYPVLWPDDPPGWLAPSSELSAWVAVQDGLVVSHVALHEAQRDPAYGTVRSASSSESFVAVGRLFARVGSRGLGAGRTMLKTAVLAAHEQGQRPFLTVLEHLAHAIRLYEDEGWMNLGP